MNKAVQSIIAVVMLSLLISSVAYAFIYEQQTNSVGQTIVNVPYFYVDNNNSDIDSSANKGTHTNFTAQQYSPDSIYDNLSEEAVESEEVAWYGINWSYRKKITIDYTKVKADLNDFPIMVNITDMGLRDYAQSDGDDILFTLDNGTTKLSHEIELFNSTTGQLISWVKANISASINTVLYFYYGNPSASNQENIPDVWSNDYVAVWHLNGDFQDSTSYNHDGTNFGSLDAAGKMSRGREFNPDDGEDHLEFGDWNVTGNKITLQTWVKCDDFGQDDPRFITKALSGSADDHVFMLGLSGSGENYLRTRIRTGTSTTTLIAGNGGDLTVNTWYFIAVTYDGDTSPQNIKILRNGVEPTSYSSGSQSRTGALVENTWPIWSGDNQNTVSYGEADGQLDEIRISNVARSPDWLETEYNNQYNSSSFYSIGIDESSTYQLDLEVQWTNIDYSEANEELCIYFSEDSGGSNNTYSLDASGGYMIIGDGTPDWGSTTGTISFWIKMDSIVQGRFYGQDGNMETRWSGTNLVLDWGGTGSMTSTTSFNADTWYFVAIVWDENNDNLFLYVGDENNTPTLDANSLSGTWVSTTPAPTENRFMNGLGGTEPVDGQGDDLRYWNVARSLAELQSDYNVTLAGSETSLRSYFRLNNNFDDIGPDNNDGSGSGSYSFSTDTPFTSVTTEDLRVDVWTGSDWQNVFTDLANGWNNVTITSYLTASTFTIRFKGAIETIDTVQDSWNIDASVIHAWT